MIMRLIEFSETVTQWIELAALALEVLAVAIIVISIFYSTGRYLYYRNTQPSKDVHYGEYKVIIGKTLLLGLEILVAADIVKTVAVEATFESIAILGLLVLIRTFLSWSLEVEIEGRWPWQQKKGVGTDST
jgi:uncharacterized membrane protein